MCVDVRFMRKRPTDCVECTDNPPRRHTLCSRVRANLHNWSVCVQYSDSIHVAAPPRLPRAWQMRNSSSKKYRDHARALLEWVGGWLCVLVCECCARDRTHGVRERNCRNVLKTNHQMACFNDACRMSLIIRLRAICDTPVNAEIYSV